MRLHISDALGVVILFGLLVLFLNVTPG